MAAENQISAKDFLSAKLLKIAENIEQAAVQLEKLNQCHDQLKRELSDVQSQMDQAPTAYLQECNSRQSNPGDLQATSNSEIPKSNPVTESTDQLFLDINLSDLPVKDKAFEFSLRNQFCGNQVFVELRPTSTQKATAGEVRVNNNGSCKVSVKVEEIGKAKLFVNISSIPVKGSPFNMKVLPKQDAHPAAPTEIVAINCDGKMGTPWGVAIAKNDTGIWAVVDNENCCVYIFDSQNQLLHKFGKRGNEVGEFCRPCGVTFDINNNLYVVDGLCNRVQKFDTYGNFLLQFGVKGSGDGELMGPYDVATHNGYAYVTEYHNKRISVFKSEGKFCFSFGCDHLCSAQNVAISTNDKWLFVTDNIDHKVCIFTLEGDFVKKFGQQGNSEGEINLPLGITILNEKIIISDKNHRVSVFHKNGQFSHCFGSYGDGKGELNYPYGIASHCKTNSVYVTDYVNHRVQIFHL